MIVRYSRYSPRPEKQTIGRRYVDESHSIEQQESLMREFCGREKLAIRASFHDRQASGADRDRVGLARAIAACKRGDTLLCFEWDRLGRDPLKMLLVVEDLAAKHCRLRSVVEGYWDDDQDFTRELVSIILAGIARYKRRTGNKRTSQVMRRRQANGERMSKIPPYGFRVEDDRLVKDEAEQAMIFNILSAHHSGGHGPRGIARVLNHNKIPCRGNGWCHSTVAAILRREAAKERHDGPHAH